MAAQVSRWHHKPVADLAGANVALRRLDQVLNDAVVYDDKATTFTQMITFAAGVAFAGAVTFAAMVTINPGPLSVGVAPPSSGTVRVDGAVAISNNATNLAAAYGSTFALVGGGGSPNTGRLLFGDGTGWQFNFSKRTGGVTTDLFRFKDSGEMDMFAGSPYNIVLTGSPTGVLQIKLGDISVFGVVGTRQSGGDVLLAANASQPTSNADFWVQSLGSQASTRIMLNSGGNIDFSGAGSGQASGTDATFWTLRARMTGAAFTPGAAGGLTLGTAALPWGVGYLKSEGEILRLRGDSHSVQFWNAAAATRWGYILSDSTGVYLAADGGTDLIFQTAATNRAKFTTAAFAPTSGGGLTLGTPSLPFSALNLGGVATPTITLDSTGSEGYLDLRVSGTRRGGIQGNGAGILGFFDSTGNVKVSMTGAAWRPESAGGMSLGTGSLPWNGAYIIDNAGVQFFTSGGSRRSGIQGASTDRVELFDSGGTTRISFVLAAASQLIAGGTSFAVRNNANSADNLIILDAGGATFRTTVALPGPLTLTTAASKIIPGATSFAVRDNADANDNLLVADAGTLAVRLSVNAVGGDYLRAGTRVVSTRVTGWSAWTGTADRTSKASDTSTLQDHGRVLKALIDDLRAHGLIGT